MSKFKVGDIVCLITTGSRLTPQVVTKVYPDNGNYLYTDYCKVGIGKPTIKRSSSNYIMFSDLVRDFILGENAYNPNLDRYIAMNGRKFAYDCFFDSLYHLDDEHLQSIGNHLDYGLEDFLNVVDQSIAKIAKYGNTTDTGIQKEKPTMPKLYKIVKDENNKAIKKPTDFGEYIATDGEFMMLKMVSQSSTSDKPVVQAFKPSQIEEVKPWTFEVRNMHGNKFTYSAPKDSVKTHDVLIADGSTQGFCVVSQINTSADGDNVKAFKGRRVATEVFGSDDGTD